MSDKTVTFLSIEHYSGHPEVKAAAELLVDKYAESLQFIKTRQQWIMAARKLIASLWMREGDLFRFSTKKDYFSTGSRKQVWMTPKTLKLFKTMLELEWVVKVQSAIPPQYSKKSKGGMAAIYCRRLSFRQLMNTLTEADVQLDESLPLVTLTGVDDQYVELPEAYIATESHRNTVNALNMHYALLEISKLMDANGNPLSLTKLRYRRRFKGHMGNGGRFYSPFCNLPKHDRLSITIRGEPVGSWDFSQLHPTLLLLLHHGVGMEQNLFSTGDVYSMPDYSDLPRSAHKKFINSIFNAQSREAATRSIMTAHRYWDLFEDCWVYETYKGSAERQGLPVWPKSPKKAAQDYIDSFLFRHPAFEGIAFKGLWGTLQLLDSQIMQEAVKTATAMAIPVLPVHDELVVPRSQKDTVRSILVDSFHHVTNGKFKNHNPKMEWSERVA